MRAALITIFSVLFIDQLVKIYIKTHFYLGESYEITSWFHIHFIENPGMAFGTEIGGAGSSWGKLALSIFRLAAIIGIAWYLSKLIRQKAKPMLIICIGLIFAGAFGNMIDSMFYGLFFNESYELQIASFMPKEGGYTSFLFGNVVDMISFSFFPPIFNIADSSISIGVAILVLKQKSFFGKNKEIPPVTENTDIPPTDASQSAGDIVS
jgi:signal peptidase II